MAVRIETRSFTWEIDGNGITTLFCGQDGVSVATGEPCAIATASGNEYPCTGAERNGGRIALSFDGADAVLRVDEFDRHAVFYVESVNGPLDSLSFVHVPLTLTGGNDEPFAACALALNLRTNVVEIPQPMSRLVATCFSRTGITGARAAVVACPRTELRDALKDAVSGDPDAPKSAIGGPWAMDSPQNYGSYLFNFDGITLDTVDKWIELAGNLGFTQIDFHGGESFRFGDCEPNPERYPGGVADFKAVIDRLHEAGIQAGLHTYAFFIDKRCPWVTPVPDPRLAYDAEFTLAEPLTEDATEVIVRESTESMSAITGFFERNSVTLRIGTELITYTGVKKTPPYAFTGCERGACGTTVSQHAAGERAAHLKECFGLFVPDPETSLFTEVIEKNADMYNTCGFDMIYLDALDGEDILGGREWSWHYGSRFVWELAERLERPAIFEMSTFHHHLWYVRARMGAWDQPNRSHKRFIDTHVESNWGNQRMFLPTNLGWWAVKTWNGHQNEPTHSDDIEYLCAKAIGTNSSLSLMGVDPETYPERPALRRLSSVIRTWEELRRTGDISDSVRHALAEPGAEFTYDGSAIRAACYVKRVPVPGEPWTLQNPYRAQTPFVRIEALPTAADWDDPAAQPVVTPDSPPVLARSADGVTGTVQTIEAEMPDRSRGAIRLTAQASGVDRNASWIEFRTSHDEPLDLSETPALGFWVRGDRSGAVLNAQLTCPQHLSHGIADHYITLNFDGWRYVTLIEPEGERYANYVWPYGSLYAIYREFPDLKTISTVSFWLNGVPERGTQCIVSAVRALPLVEAPVTNPVITCAVGEICFETSVQTGEYVEMTADGCARLNGPNGEERGEVVTSGAVTLGEGVNSCTTQWEGRGRARITLGMRGEAVE